MRAGGLLEALGRGAGAALAASVLIGDSPWSHGLAPALIGVLVGVGLFAPLRDHLAEARVRPPLAPLDSSIGRLVPALVAAATLAPVSSVGGPFAVILGALGLVGARRLGARVGPVVPVALIGAAMLLQGGEAAMALGQAGPWTLLEPSWTDGTSWLPGALLTGLLLGGAGRTEASRPGSSLLIAGVGATAIVLVALRDGASWEASLGETHQGVLEPLTAALIAFSVAAATPTEEPLDDRVGALLAGWLGGPGAAALPWCWGLLLPMLVAGRILLRLGPSRRSPLAIAGLVALVTAIVVGWAPLPSETGPAAAVAATGVALLWLVAPPRVVEAVT